MKKEQQAAQAALNHLTKAESLAMLGNTTIRDLLEELRLRGDLAMVAMPTTPRGADGAVLSAMAGSQLKSLETDTLEAVRGS
jgi:hypothetical protein